MRGEAELFEYLSPLIFLFDPFGVMPIRECFLYGISSWYSLLHLADFDCDSGFYVGIHFLFRLRMQRISRDF